MHRPTSFTFVSCVWPNTELWSRVVLTRSLLNKEYLAMRSVAQPQLRKLHLITQLPDDNQGWIWGTPQFILILSSCEDNDVCCIGCLTPWNIYFTVSGRTSVRVRWRSRNRSFSLQFGNVDDVSLILGSLTEAWVSDGQLIVFQYALPVEFFNIDASVLV